MVGQCGRRMTICSEGRRGPDLRAWLKEGGGCFRRFQPFKPFPLFPTCPRHTRRADVSRLRRGCRRTASCSKIASTHAPPAPLCPPSYHGVVGLGGGEGLAPRQQHVHQHTQAPPALFKRVGGVGWGGRCLVHPSAVQAPEAAKQQVTNPNAAPSIPLHPQPPPVPCQPPTSPPSGCSHAPARSQEPHSRGCRRRCRCAAPRSLAPGE